MVMFLDDQYMMSKFPPFSISEKDGNNKIDKKHKKRVSFADRNQVITIDEIDKVILSKYNNQINSSENQSSSLNSSLIMNNNQQNKIIFNTKKIVLGLIILIFAFILYMKL